LRAVPGQKLAVRPGVVYTPDGIASLYLTPGDYTVYATRGFEYGLTKQRVKIHAGERQRLALGLHREVRPPGFVASDTHVHTFTLSRHGDATLEERAVTLAGEGIELPIATDHDILADYGAAVSATSVGSFITPVVGCEVTTARGHFNVFPMHLGSPVPDAKIEDWPRLMEAIRAVPGMRVVILNHPRNIHSGFQPFAATNFNAVTGENLKGPEFTFDAVEVVNSSAMQTDWMQSFRDWFALLNHGYRITAVGSSDCHDVSRYIVGQGRSYVRCDDSRPGAIDIEAACRGFREGRVLVSLGLLTSLMVESGGSRYDVGDLAPVRQGLRVTVTVQSPSWIEPDRVELYANGAKIRELTAKPQAGLARLSPKERSQGVKWKAVWNLPQPAQDLHLVAIATGPGVRKPFWATARPYQPSSPIWESRVIGATNPIWIDADGDGKFSEPREYAQRIMQQTGADPTKLFAALAAYDGATASQAASLWRTLGYRSGSAEFRRAMQAAPLRVRNGFLDFERAQLAAENK